MDQKLLVLLSTLVVCLAPSVHGTSHLMFSNNTQVNITRTGCGVTKQCVDSPANCTLGVGCLFSSITSRRSTGSGDFDVDVQLSGNSSGYIALGITQNQTVGLSSVFVCAQNNTNNGSFFFRTTQRNNTDTTAPPTLTERTVKEIRGNVSSGSLIQCEFTVPGVNATNGNVTIFIGPGNANGTTLGSFNITEVRVLNLAQLFTTMAPMVNTTLASSSTAGAASLLLWCALIWPIMHLV